MSGNERTMMFQMPATDQGRLVGLEGSVKGRVFALSTGTFIIGRGETCDMPLKDPGVSRQHAKIVAEGEQYILLDMESRNGTFLNGKPTRKATLQEGDEVRICAAAFRFTFLDWGGSGAGIPPEMDLDDNTNENASDDGPTDPSRAREGTVSTVDQSRVRPSLVPTTTGSMPRPPQAQRETSAAPSQAHAQMGQELRVLKTVVIIALVTALVAIGAAVGVVMVVRKPAKPVVVEKVIEKPVVVEKIVEKPVIVEKGPAPAETTKDPVAAKDPVEVAAKDPVAVAPKDPVEKVNKPKPVEKAQASEWLTVRSGPEIVRAAAAGAITSVTTSAEAVLGDPIVTIDGKAIDAPASGAITGLAKVGDNVRKGQIVARIAESRARADVPAAFAKRAKKGAKVELQLEGGSTKSATIDAVSAGTIFVDAGGAAVKSIRFP